MSAATAPAKPFPLEPLVSPLLRPVPFACGEEPFCDEPFVDVRPLWCSCWLCSSRMSRAPLSSLGLEARARFRSLVSDALLSTEVLGSLGREAERRRLLGRSEESAISGLCAGMGAVVGRWVWRSDGGGCAVDTCAGRRLGLESTVGPAVVSGEVVRGLLSPSRTDT